MFDLTLASSSSSNFAYVNIGKLHELHRHSTVKKTVAMYLVNYFKRQTTTENETVQIAAA